VEWDRSQRSGERSRSKSLETLIATIPADWKEVTPKTELRLMEYQLSRQGGDRDHVVVYFGQPVGGSLEDNVQRWVDQVDPPVGKRREDITRIERFKVGDIDAVLVDMTGTYKERLGPHMPAQNRSNYRVISVLLPTGGLNYSIRLLGPDRSVTHHQPAFVKWLKDVK
jgi:hypothetical protein